jgi:YD repeat-containing protein
MGITKSNLSSSETYIISYWTRNGSSYSISGTQGSVIKGKTISGWTYYEHHVTGVNAISIGGSGYIDELRLYPSNAKMTTYTYKPLVGMTSTCAPDNTIQYYKYDGFGRLTRITNEDGMILKQYDYKYQVGATQ